MTQPSAGWFPDPSDPSRQRYFDGTTWTEDYAPLGAPAPGIGQAAKPGMSNGAKIALGVGAAILLLIVFSSIGNSDKKGKDDVASSSTRSNSLSTTRTTQAKPSGPVVAPAGSSVRDGKFEFQVLGVERSASKEGIFNPDEAKGEFFIVKLRVTNIGDEARTFFASNQNLIIGGNKYEASSALSDDGFMEEINPGLGIEAEVAFDIPPGAVPDEIVCHDSAFSGGAHLAL
ncbi:DUF4352 domain-containing protein [Mycolicibacter longobardus]|nr:DUF4352 domain-containing protein [Mycolicibacter longobardus]